MNREDIIRMAREVGLPHWYETEGIVNEALLIKFAALVASAERERILDTCKEGLWDAEGIRYHLDKQERGQA